MSQFSFWTIVEKFTHFLYNWLWKFGVFFLLLSMRINTLVIQNSVNIQFNTAFSEL